jgi:hypothetical protein
MLCCFHAYLIVRGITTNEYNKRTFKQKKNPYSRGMCGNWLYALCPPHYASAIRPRSLVTEDTMTEKEVTGAAVALRSASSSSSSSSSPPTRQQQQHESSTHVHKHENHKQNVSDGESGLNKTEKDANKDNTSNATNSSSSSSVTEAKSSNNIPS